MSRRNREFTIRKGTSERYWYTNAAYVAIAIFLVLGGIALGVSLQGSDRMVALSGTFALGVFGMTLFGLVTYPTLFKDAAYVRATSAWSVKWWYYLLFG